MWMGAGLTRPEPPSLCLSEPGVDLTHILPDLDYPVWRRHKGHWGPKCATGVGSPTAGRRSGLDSAQRTNQISCHRLRLPDREAASERQPGPMAALKLGAIRAPVCLLVVVLFCFVSGHDAVRCESTLIRSRMFNAHTRNKECFN